MQWYMPWEMDFLLMLQGMRSDAMDLVMAFVSNIGNAGIVWIGLSLVLMIIPKTRRIGIQMLVSIAITFVIGNLILKPLVNRARPCDYPVFDTLKTVLVARPTDASFPSGHSMNGFTSAVALFCCNKKWGSVALLVAAVIAFSRLYNFMHFPTDVLAGILIGTVLALLVNFVFKKLFIKV